MTSTTVVRQVGYTGTAQQLEWTYGNGAQVTAYLWGGGGGGGGNDSNRGGYGCGAGYAAHQFTINNGDVIEVAVGRYGAQGASGTNGGGGGPGPSFSPFIFTSSVPPSTSQPAVYRYTNGQWSSFLNTYGVWESSTYQTVFERNYTVYFPVSGNYTFTGSCDNYGSASVDGAEVLSIGGYTTTYTSTVYVTAGNHTIREYGVNTGGPGAYALTIVNTVGSSYNGGLGGGAGGGGSSGAGGGGGGATVLLLNGTVQSVAGGGGGGGGGGNAGVAAGENAPGNRGNDTGQNSGQNGLDKSGDGGGGGAGGGGYWGGQGGSTPGGDQGGYAGVYGTSYGNLATANPSGTTPGGRTNPYYAGNPGVGGVNAQPGSSGYAAFVFDIPGVFVNQVGTFVPVSKVWAKTNDRWQQAQSIWVKQNNVWQQCLGGMPPYFTSIYGQFGVIQRPYG